MAERTPPGEQRQSPTVRYCRCGARVARDNPDVLCSSCRRRAQQAALEPPEIPPALWQTEQMRDALASHHLGQIVHAWRHHWFHGQPLPQELVAGWLGITQTQLSRIERGAPIQDLHRLTRWARALHIPPEHRWFATPDHRDSGAGGTNGRSLLAGEWTPQSIRLLLDDVRGAATVRTPESAAHLAHEWLLADPPQVVEVRAGRRIGDGLLEKVERRGEHLRHMDDFIGGGDLYQLVERELNVTVRLLDDAAYTERIGRRLLRAVGELSQVAGWVAVDAGEPAAATRFYIAGIHAAHAAGDRALAANLISLLSYLYSNLPGPGSRSPREAVLLAHTGYSGAERHASATCRALLQERIAWAHARAGNLRETERALGRVDEVFAHQRPEDDPEWVYWLDRDEIDVMAGRCYTELGQPERAEPLLRGVLDRYDDRRAREVALYVSWLAQGYALMGELEEAAGQASRALLIAAGVNSARGNQRIQVLHHQLQPHQAVPAVRDFEALYQDLVGQ